MSLALLSGANAGREPLPIDAPNNKRTVTFVSEGEDASSAFYYFFYSLPHEDVSKVRVLWDGGSGNKPTITDYYLEGTFIWIIERSAERSGLPLLEKGKDAPFQIVRERIIKTVAVEAESPFVFPDVEVTPRLSEDERSDLTALVSLLARTRKPIPGK